MPNQDYVLYCYSLPPGTGSMFAMGISVPAYIGPIQPLLYNDAPTLQQSLTVLGLTAAQQTQLLAAIAAPGFLYILSAVSIPDSIAKNFGIYLHDGDMPDEPNQIEFTRCSAPGAPLAVNVLLNDQIMPAPVRGCFHWNKVRAALIQSRQFTSADADQIKTAIEQNGSETRNWNGISTGIIAGLA